VKCENNKVLLASLTGVLNENWIDFLFFIDLISVCFLFMFLRFEPNS